MHKVHSHSAKARIFLILALPTRESPWSKASRRPPPQEWRSRRKGLYRPGAEKATSYDCKTVFSSHTTQRQCCSSSFEGRSDFMSPANHTRSKEENAATNLTKDVVWVDARLVASAAMMTRSAPGSQLVWRSTCTTRHEHSFWARASRIRYGHIQTKLTFICGFSLNPPPPPRSKHRPGKRVIAAKSRLWVHKVTIPYPRLVVGHSRRCTTCESTFTACFSPLFALFPRWDRTGCLKQWELDKGRERKTIIWSANRNFQTPHPHLHRPIFRVWPLFRFWTPPLLRTDPYSGLILIPDSTLFHSKKTEPWQPQLVGWYERRPLHDPNMVLAYWSKKKTTMFGAKAIVLSWYWVLFPAAASEHRGVWPPKVLLSCYWAFPGFMAVIFQGGLVR